jgi:hypothetical protein
MAGVTRRLWSSGAADRSPAATASSCYIGLAWDSDGATRVAVLVGDECREQFRHHVRALLVPLAPWIDAQNNVICIT